MVDIFIIIRFIWIVYVFFDIFWIFVWNGMDFLRMKLILFNWSMVVIGLDL